MAKLIFQKGTKRLSFGESVSKRRYKDFKKDFDRTYHDFTDLTCEEMFKCVGGKVKKAGGV